MKFWACSLLRKNSKYSWDLWKMQQKKYVAIW